MLLVLLIFSAYINKFDEVWLDFEREISPGLRIVFYFVAF